MFKIILYSNCNKKTNTLKFCRILSHYGGVLYFCGGCAVGISDADTEFTVYETASLSHIDMESGIVIFEKDDFKEGFPRIANADKLSFLVNSQNTAALDELLNASLTAITCGMSAKDSITISSIDDGSAVISVQRELIMHSGSVLEPCEIKLMNTGSLTKEEILTIGSVLILSEKITDGLTELKF